ncbi:MAG: CBS domain-containing protein [Actinomyces sp.]|nr:MAG: CBS domain-containing protein [Actinomyces sp.]
MVLPDDPVRSVAAFDPLTATPHDTLRELCARMTEGGCGFLLVVKPGAPAAVVTERDIVRAIGEGAEIDDVWATDVMTREVLEISADAPISEAARLMMTAGVRHLVVRDDAADTDGAGEEAGDAEGEEAAGERVGVVSIRDILEPLLETVEAALARDS